MPGKGQQIQRGAEQEARLQDAITRDFADELLQVVRLLATQIRALYREFDLRDGRLVSTASNLGRAIRIRQDILNALDAAGFRDVLMAAVDEPLDRLAAKVFQTSKIANQAATLTPFDVNALAAMKELQFADLFSIGEEAARTIWRGTLDAVVSARPMADVIADIEEALDATAAEARTIYDTGVSIFSRQVEQLHTTGEPDELFLYAGPADSKTRTFCMKHVGKVFSRADIEEMDNGQLPDVMTTGGGYNCRHVWKRVSLLDEELRDLHESGGRLEHIEAQLQEVG